ncbi:MAG: hypothetical protein EAZ76_02405 [Nostocales cyanobacterium]|nr:MAG: hypothetical protein EAZ87_05295 [Nostocales cyanobacterium]TAF19987.1 MAG: hypothetical protein EAZ76_02405 [Nostocales cyanobacterium]
MFDLQKLIYLTVFIVDRIDYLCIKNIESFYRGMGENAVLSIVLNKNPTPDINSSIEMKLKKRLKQHNRKNTDELIKYKSKVLEEHI